MAGVYVGFARQNNFFQTTTKIKPTHSSIEKKWLLLQQKKVLTCGCAFCVAVKWSWNTAVRSLSGANLINMNFIMVDCSSSLAFQKCSSSSPPLMLILFKASSLREGWDFNFSFGEVWFLFSQNVLFVIPIGFILKIHYYLVFVTTDFVPLTRSMLVILISKRKKILKSRF